MPVHMWNVDNTIHDTSVSLCQLIYISTLM